MTLTLIKPLWKSITDVFSLGEDLIRTTNWGWRQKIKQSDVHGSPLQLLWIWTCVSHKAECNKHNVIQRAHKIKHTNYSLVECVIRSWEKSFMIFLLRKTNKQTAGFYCKCLLMSFSVICLDVLLDSVHLMGALRRCVYGSKTGQDLGLINIKPLHQHLCIKYNIKTFF